MLKHDESQFTYLVLLYEFFIDIAPENVIVTCEKNTSNTITDDFSFGPTYLQSVCLN